MNVTLLARLAPHLPYLRRYARALTGDQSTADNYVRVSLQAVAAGENLPDETLPPRAALYHTFHAIWRTTGARLEPTEDRLAFLRNAGPRRGGNGMPSRSALGIFRDLYDRHAVISIGPVPEHVRLAMSTNRDDRQLRDQQDGDDADLFETDEEESRGFPDEQPHYKENNQ